MYTVRRGDTLIEIARKNGCSVDELTRLNGIKNKNLIYIGQRLKLTNTNTYTNTNTNTSKLAVVIVNRKGEAISNFKIKIFIGGKLVVEKLTNDKGLVILDQGKSGEGIIIQGWSKTTSSYKVISNRFITEARNLGIGISLDTIKFEAKTDKHSQPSNSSSLNTTQSKTQHTVNNENQPLAQVSVNGCKNCSELTELELKQIFKDASAIGIKTLVDAYNKYSEKFLMKNCVSKAHFFF